MMNGIPIKDIPQSLLEEITAHLNNYFVSFYVFSQDSTPKYSPIGSGTLVKIAGTHYILTAAHVWQEIENVKEFGLSLSTYQPLNFTIKPETIIAQKLCPAENCDSNVGGPDLALLQLARPDVSNIETHKTFLNLARQKVKWTEDSPDTEDSFWVVMGMVKEFSDVQTHPEERTVVVKVYVRGFFGSATPMDQIDGYDYLDLSVNLKLSGVPLSFVGVSGGGLWRIDLSMAKSGKIDWDRIPRFRGVEFGQLPVIQGQRMVRCHGPRSIFKGAWEKWQLPIEG